MMLEKMVFTNADSDLLNEAALSIDSCKVSPTMVFLQILLSADHIKASAQAQWYHHKILATDMAMWYRCDLSETRLSSLTGKSLRGSLEAASWLLLQALTDPPGQGTWAGGERSVHCSLPLGVVPVICWWHSILFPRPGT